jgi:hypothetical protein
MGAAASLANAPEPHKNEARKPIGISKNNLAKLQTNYIAATAVKPNHRNLARIPESYLPRLPTFGLPVERFRSQITMMFKMAQTKEQADKILSETIIIIANEKAKLNEQLESNTGLANARRNGRYNEVKTLGESWIENEDIKKEILIEAHKQRLTELGITVGGKRKKTKTRKNRR